MGHHRFEMHIAAPPDRVFDLYTNLDRMHEWTGGMSGIVDLSGPVTAAGTSYTVMFGRMRSPTVVLASDRPRQFKTHFGNGLLRGTMAANFAPDGRGTLMTQELRTEGWLPGLAARIFSIGSWKGSFRGELREFARIAEQEPAV